MKNIFKYLFILFLTTLSFYYTFKVTNLFKNEDVVMKEINEYADTHDKKCIEGYISEDGVILGINGLVVDKSLSYSNMKGSKFNESLIKYKKDPCIVSLDNNKEYYVIGGNSSKDSVSLVINVLNGKNIKDIVDISEKKNVKLSFAIDYKYLKNNSEYVKSLIRDGYNFLYKGDAKDLKLFIKDIDKNNKNFCIEIYPNELLESCYKNNINTIKTKYVFNNMYLTNIKNNLNKGNIFVLDENIILKNEIGVIINYIRSKGMKESSIEKLLQ